MVDWLAYVVVIDVQYAFFLGGVKESDSNINSCRGKESSRIVGWVGVGSGLFCTQYSPRAIAFKGFLLATRLPTKCLTGKRWCVLACLDPYVKEDKARNMPKICRNKCIRNTRRTYFCIVLFRGNEKMQKSRILPNCFCYFL